MGTHLSPLNATLVSNTHVAVSPVPTALVAVVEVNVAVVPTAEAALAAMLANGATPNLSGVTFGDRNFISHGYRTYYR